MGMPDDDGMRELLMRVRSALGNEGAIENARRDSDEMMRALAAVEAAAARISARTAARIDQAA